MGLLAEASNNSPADIKQEIKVMQSLRKVIEKHKDGKAKMDWCDSISLVKDNRYTIIRYGVTFTGGIHAHFAVCSNQMIALHAYSSPPDNISFEDKTGWAVVSSDTLGKPILHRKAGRKRISASKLMKNGVDTDYLFNQCVETDKRLRPDSEEKVGKCSKKWQKKHEEEIEKLEEYKKNSGIGIGGMI